MIWRRIGDVAGRHGYTDGGAGLLSALRGFSYDTSMLEQPLSLILGRDTFGSTQLVLGSDAPRCDVGDIITGVKTCPGLTPAVKADILDANAARLLSSLAESINS